ncbi:unnamed protein product, partial [Meganyctiphanes norvegica]
MSHDVNKHRSLSIISVEKIGQFLHIGIRMIALTEEPNIDSAWMSSELFTDYFIEEIVPTIKKHFPQQRVIVTMANATCHPPSLNDIDDLIDVQFLPPNTTSLIQPCDQQVIFSLKSRVRNVYFSKLLTYVRTHAEADNPYWNV